MDAWQAQCQPIFSDGPLWASQALGGADVEVPEAAPIPLCQFQYMPAPRQHRGRLFDMAGFPNGWTELL